jgi:hypothetical protein
MRMKFSVHTGGGWVWHLEKQPARPVTEPPVEQLLASPTSIGDTYAEVHVPKDDPEEASGVSRERRISSGWIRGVARLNNHCSFTGIPSHRWRQFLSDCNNFLASGKNWAERAAKLGWDALDLFGCSRIRPLDHLGSAGLLWAINGGRLVELHRDWAVIELAANGSRRIFDRRRVDTAKVTLPWIEISDRSGA